MSCPSVNEDELDLLEAYLLDRMEKGLQPMPLDVAHGFLTAVITGPQELGPEHWLPPIFGHPEFDDEAEAEAMAQRVVALQEQIAHELEHSHFAPIIIHKPADNDEDPLPLPYGWCEGYMFGMNMHGEHARERMSTDAQASQLLAPIMAFLMYEEDQLLNPPNTEVHRQTTQELPMAAMSLYSWWRQTDLPHPRLS